MSTFKSVNPDDFKVSPFQLIGKEWMLIASKKDGKVNAMTASWGGLGVMWGKNVAYIVVRKSRFTKEMIDGSDSFSLSFFDRSKYQKMLSYMGTVSGRDEDKIAKAGLTVEHFEDIPYFGEASKVLVCKKLFCQPMDMKSFTVDGIEEKWYSDKDYHDLYIGEIVDILGK